MLPSSDPASLRLLSQDTLWAAVSDGHREGKGKGSFANGGRGIDYFKSGTADLLVTDIFMPEMEGLETIKTARHLQPAMQIIAMSGVSFDGGDYLRIAERFGAIATLKKPFRRSELLALVSRVLAPAHS